MTPRLIALLLCLAWPRFGAGEDGAALLQVQAKTRNFTENLMVSIRASNSTWSSGLEDGEWYALTGDTKSTNQMYAALAENMSHADFPSLTFGGVRRMINAVPGMHIPDLDPPIRGFWQISVLDTQHLGGMVLSTADYRRRYRERWNECMQNTEKDFKETMDSIENYVPTNHSDFVQWVKSVMAKVEGVWTSFHQFAIDEKKRFEPIWQEALARTNTVPETLPDDCMNSYEVNSQDLPFCWSGVFRDENLKLMKCLRLVGEFKERARNYVDIGQAWLPKRRIYLNFVPTLVQMTMFMVPQPVKSEFMKAVHESDVSGQVWIATEKRILERAIAVLDKQMARRGYR